MSGRFPGILAFLTLRTFMAGVIGEHVFPVVGSDPGNDSVKHVYGSAFALNKRVFMTTAHAIESASNHRHHGIACVEGENGLSIKTTEVFEQLKGVDVAIVRTKDEVPHCHLHKWPCADLPLFDDVFSLGYPMSWDPQNQYLYARGLQGHVVSNRPCRWLSRTAEAYELSFEVPAGMAGAPLLARRNNAVAGVVLGNTPAHKEVTLPADPAAGRDGPTLGLEPMHYGIAIKGTSLLELDSMILGTTLVEYLSQNLLLIR